MAKHGILVTFPASILFTVESESPDNALDIIKTIVKDFNPDDVKLEYDVDTKLLKIADEQVEDSLLFLEDIPTDLIVLEVSKLPFMNDKFIYNYNTSKVVNLEDGIILEREDFLVKLRELNNLYEFSEILENYVVTSYESI